MPLFWQVDVPSHFVGLVLENCNLPYANHGHVILGDPSPILFYPISSTEIRCLVDVPGQKLPSLGNGEMATYLKTVVAPQVPIYNCAWLHNCHVFPNDEHSNKFKLIEEIVCFRFLQSCILLL